MPFLLLHLGLVFLTVKLGQTVQEGSVEDLDLEVESYDCCSFDFQRNSRR